MLIQNWLTIHCSSKRVYTCLFRTCCKFFEIYLKLNKTETSLVLLYFEVQTLDFNSTPSFEYIKKNAVVLILNKVMYIIWLNAYFISDYTAKWIAELVLRRLQLMHRYLYIILVESLNKSWNFNYNITKYDTVDISSIHTISNEQFYDILIQKWLLRFYHLIVYL